MTWSTTTADSAAAQAEELLPFVYDELRRLAAHKLSHEQPGQILQPTDLVHEAYLRLAGRPGKQVWHGRGHFFAAAAEAMRRILVDHARQRSAAKRGGHATRVVLDEYPGVDSTRDMELLALDEALGSLARHDHRKAELVKLRYFAGFTLREAAELLGISTSTADADWAYAKAWLAVRLGH
ncbi:MAG: ECF-type sigma factor [Pirellulaceae bacterium]